MKLGSPFDRKTALILITTFVERGYGSYNELIDLTMKDLIELQIAIDSREKEKQLREII